MVIFQRLDLLISVILLTCQFLLTSSKGLTARISPKTSVVFRQGYGVFNCYVTGDPAPIVTWRNNGHDITTNSRKIQKISGGYMIRFGKLYRQFHHGNISCKASNGVDTPVTVTATLNVLQKTYNPADPSLPAGFPKPIAIYNAYVYVIVGKSITLVVNITGNPTPKITWFKDQYLMDWTNPRITLLQNNSLYLTNAQLADDGLYDYMAENDKGRIFSRPWRVIPRIIKTAPVFINGGPKDRVVDPQTDIVINCSASGYPKPSIHWKTNPINRVVANDAGLLKIINILYSTTYTCVADNDVGKQTKLVKITVRAIPLAPVNVVEMFKTASSIAISWQEGNSSLPITSHVVKHRKKGDLLWSSAYKVVSHTVWVIKDLDAYTDYEVHVFSSNNFGTSKGSSIVTFRTDESAPSTAPRNVVVKAIGKRSFEISWEPPVQPNGQVISYMIHYTDEAKREYKYWNTESSVLSPHKVYNLKENHRYVVVVSARTASGSGPLSKHFLVQTVKGAPSEPQDVEAKVLSSTVVQVSWSKPSFNGGGQGIIGFEVYYNVSSTLMNTKVDIQSPDDYTKKVTGLSPFTTYKFAVAAKTDAGSGPISVTTMAQTVEDVPSASPANLTCVAQDAFTLHCSWNPPPLLSRNGLITTYKIRYKAVNQRYSFKEVPVSILSQDLASLQPYTLYEVDIAGKTKLGQGPYSNPISVTTKETKPFKAPKNVEAEVVNSTAIHMKWQAPSPPFGAQLLGYIVYYRQYPKEVNMRTEITWGNKMDIVLANLKPETTYELSVAIRSAKGSGKVSNVLRVVTKRSPPPIPILFHPQNLPPPKVGVHLSWRSNARDIQEFRLRYAKEVEIITNVTLLRKLTYVEKSLSPSITSYTFDNFEHGLYYHIKLSVRNPGGWSKERQIWQQMDAAKPSGAPLNLKVEVTSSTSLQVSWELPSKWQRNGEIIGYNLSYKRLQSNDVKQVKHLDKETKIILRDLNKFTTYEFWIRAKTVAGLGPAATIQGLTKQDVPSMAPQIIEAKGMGTEVVLLKLVPPSQPNGVIIGYDVDIYLGDPKTGAGDWKRAVPMENQKTMYIGNLLRPNFKYWFKVAAKTIAGPGPYSTAVSAKTLTFDLPLPVQKLSVSVEDSSRVKITWKVPVSTAAIVYYQISYLGKKTYRGSNNELLTMKNSDIKTFKCCEDDFAELDKLLPYTSYVANVTSLSISRKSELKSINFTTKVASTPPFSKPNITETAFTEDYIPLHLSRASERNGPISHYLVYVASLGAVLVEARSKLQEINKSYLKKRFRRDVQSKDIYITVKLPADYNSEIFNVGEGQVVNGYTNKHLTKKHFYAFSVESCVLDEHLVDAPSRLLNALYFMYNEACNRLIATFWFNHSTSQPCCLTINEPKTKDCAPSRHVVYPSNINRSSIVSPLKFAGLPNHVYVLLTSSDEGLSSQVESSAINTYSCLVTKTGFTDAIWFTDTENPLTASRENDVKSDSKLWLLGPVVAVLLLVIIVVVLCLLWRRRVRSRDNKAKKHLHALVHDEQLPMMTSPNDPVEMQRLNRETEGMREHPPIHMTELRLHIEELQANNNNLFTREYESIEPGMTFISEASAHHLNQSKNRYPNIVPYDHTRVTLQETNGFFDSDYINANIMAGYRKQNAYIATQAPLPNTITDFWQMVWEQNTRTIVMMTNLQEKGRIKCDQYWPNRVSEKFGYVTVTVVETVELAHYTLRTFRLCKDGLSDISKEVKQFQYTAWPDHGVPHYSTSLLCFIRKVRLSNVSDAGPIVVHCSAGVGRTGVFIVIDSMLERIRREQTVDVYGHVTLLRSQRNHMVQTEDQYIFIHETLLEAVFFGNTEINASDLSQYYKKLNEIGETETTNMEEQFKQLNSFNHLHRFVTAILPVNKLKNRFPKILPYEQSRVNLVPVRGVDGSNYINASFIDGYKERRTYIAAQAPLEETVNDFWRMIMEKKTNIIVMLSETNENGEEMSAEYWPNEKSAKYHFYIVDPVSVEETPNFTLRQFKVNDMMGACPSLIKLFQLRKWPERGKLQSWKGILDLIGQVHTARNNDETKGSVVVHCSSGSARTGVFCALSIVVERMRTEGVVDLLQTVRQLREQRPEMVETLEQYSFCYETALHYLSSFDHIS